MRTTSPLMTLTSAVLAAVLATGCAADPTAADEPEKEKPAETTSPDQAGAPSVTPEETCFNPEGGECLGDLAPGTYRTTIFQPGLRYTVGRGWVNAEDLSGQVWLYRADDPQEGLIGGSYVGIYLGGRIPRGCQEAWQESVGDDPDQMLRWYLDHPGLEVTNRHDVTVGGLPGTSIDLVLADDYSRTCPWSEGHPTAPILIGGGVSHLFHTILPGMTIRLVLLDQGDTNITIEITSVHSQHSFEEYLDLTDRMIGSLRFGR